MGELMRALDQILKLPRKDLTPQEAEIRDAFEHEQMRQETDETSHVGQPAKIEVAHSAQLFKLPDGSSGASIEVVILGSVITRANYKNREKDSPALCQSIGGKYGKPTEDGYQLLFEEMPDLKNMQVLCAKCPFGANAFGTDGKGKKCKEMRKLLVFHSKMKKPMLLSIPPTSIRNFDTYYDGLDNAGKVLAGMVTKITLKESGNGSNKFSNFNFEAGSMIPADQFMAAIKLREMFKDSIRSVDASDYYQTAASTMEDTIETNEDDLPF